VGDTAFLAAASGIFVLMWVAAGVFGRLASKYPRQFVGPPWVVWLVRAVAAAIWVALLVQVVAG
jgi:hypothetical protein